jgi:hypothetical protein
MKPILLKEHEVVTVQSGGKIQICRVAKIDYSGRVVLGGKRWHAGDENAVLACPFGQPGDRLWVRETSRCIMKGSDGLSGPDQKPSISVLYKAGGIESFYKFAEWFPNEYFKKGTSIARWQSATAMPKWASRISLEIVIVKIERNCSGDLVWVIDLKKVTL